MKKLIAITATVAVMAATGCETTKPKLVAATPAPTIKVPPNAPTRVTAFDPTVFNQAMAAQYAPPPPVIVAAPGRGTTVTSTSSAGTVVTTYGNSQLNLPPPPPPIYTGNQNPTVYTMPIQQP